MKKYIIPCLFSLFVLGACLPKPLEIVVPPMEEGVVVISQVVPNQVMIVVLTKTLGALQFSEENGDDLSTEIIEKLLEDSATVTVSYEGITDTLFEVTEQSGVYVSLFALQIPNRTYTLKITTNEGKEFTAVSTMLDQVTFDEVTPVIKRSTEDTFVTVHYEFTDLPGKNWYMLHVYRNTLGDSTQPNLDLNTNFARGNNILQASQILSDQTFGTSVYRDSLILPQVEVDDSIAVVLANISEDYYNYLVLRESSSNFFTELTSEPVNYPSNVEGENGYGFFNTHFPDARLFDLNDF